MKLSPALLVALALGLAFLHLPIVLLIIYSFNDSRLVTVWAGLSLRWYVQLFSDAAFLDAAWMSLKVAVTSATVALVVGTLAAYALVRLGRFRGRMMMIGMVQAPLVMPEVITGISLLLLFVTLNVDRGFMTIVIAHATLGASYVAVVVQARLVTLERDLEEAALDLGATPAASFRQIVLPLAAPAMLAGWLLAFALSLDDLILASFVSGPGSTTLPMKIYSQARLGVTPMINALSTIVIVAVSVMVVAASLLTKAGRIKATGGRTKPGIPGSPGAPGR
jgi:putrescine transport system permease protein